VRHAAVRCLIDAAVRLLACLASPLDARILGPGHRAGDRLPGAARRPGRGLAGSGLPERPPAPHRPALKRIQRFDTNLDVEALAREAHIGLSNLPPRLSGGHGHLAPAISQDRAPAPGPAAPGEAGPRPERPPPGSAMPARPIQSRIQAPVRPAPSEDAQRLRTAEG
jgi:hypothetical protein